MNRYSLFLLLLTSCGIPDAAPRPAPERQAGQHEITRPSDLLAGDGTLVQKGWSRRELLRFNIENVRGNRDHLRQWDFYTVMNRRAAINFTITDIGLAAVGSVDLKDFATGATHSAALAKFSPVDDFRLSSGSSGDSLFFPHGATRPAIRFTTDGERRTIDIEIAQSALSEEMHGRIVLTRPADDDFLALATPFDEGAALFFYEQKIPGFTAEGSLTVGSETYTFSATDSSAVMDWGRGMWPERALWRWSAAAGYVGGARVSFNLGYGFGNTAAASENIVIYDGRAQKLGQVDWKYDVTQPMRPWKVTSPDGRVNLLLNPFFYESNRAFLGIGSSELHKVYGTFQGAMTLDDGRKIEVRDFLGFAEQFRVWW